ncbi:MAG: hypothetical protein K0B16_14195, partial [Burkholderiaceae bacterium]|nr:hypothetical protein [Burkholderiaceae bacterium]
VNHGGQTTLYLTPMHAESRLIKSMIANVHAAIDHVRRAAEQLPKLNRWATLLAYICQRIVAQSVLPTPPAGAHGERVTAVFRFIEVRNGVAPLAASAAPGIPS